MRPDNTVRGKSLLFAAGAVFLFGALLVAVLIKQNYFSQTTTLYFFAPNAQGLNVGMSVKFVGFKVGRIDEISMEPQARVKVTLSLNDDYIHLINRDAKARLIKEGLIGESVVEIVPSESHARQVAQNDVLVFERARDIAELADSLAGQILPILADVKKITAALSDADGDIRASIKNAQLLSSDLVRTAQQLNSLAVNGNRVLAVVHHSVGIVDEALPTMMYDLESGTNNMQAISAEIRKMTTPPSGQIPRMLNHGSVLIRDSKEIVGEAKRTWPIRAMLPEAEQVLLPLDGYVAPLPPRVSK
ncbi:MAG: MlaD family protein [Gallionella sp.]|nr:MlaD family protein [Gallionella sp.]